MEPLDLVYGVAARLVLFHVGAVFVFRAVEVKAGLSGHWVRILLRWLMMLVVARHAVGRVSVRNRVVMMKRSKRCVGGGGWLVGCFIGRLIDWLDGGWVSLFRFSV